MLRQLAGDAPDQLQRRFGLIRLQVALGLLQLRAGAALGLDQLQACSPRRLPGSTQQLAVGLAGGIEGAGRALGVAAQLRTGARRCRGASGSRCGSAGCRARGRRHGAGSRWPRPTALWRAARGPRCAGAGRRNRPATQRQQRRGVGPRRQRNGVAVTRISVDGHAQRHVLLQVHETQFAAADGLEAEAAFERVAGTGMEQGAAEIKGRPWPACPVRCRRRRSGTAAGGGVGAARWPPAAAAARRAPRAATAEAAVR